MNRYMKVKSAGKAVTATLLAVFIFVPEVRDETAVSIVHYAAGYLENENK